MDFSLPLTHEILHRVAAIDHGRGAWSRGPGIPENRAERMREAARAQSVAASCRMSGIHVTDVEVANLLLDPATPVRDKHEVLGLATALEWPGLEADPVLSTRRLRELHAVMLGGDPGRPEPSPWRRHPANREVFSPEGQATGRILPTLPPRMLRAKVDDLLTWLEFELRTREHHPLTVIGTFVLVFLAASPFDRANGRMSRLLTVRLLRRAGYGQLSYASLERVIEETHEAYHDSFAAAQTHLWTGRADLLPWLDYFLDTLAEHGARLVSALEVESRAVRLSALQQRILDTVRAHGVVDAALLLAATGTNRNTLKDNMRRLVRLGLLDKMGERRGTRYKLAR